MVGRMEVQASGQNPQQVYTDQEAGEFGNWCRFKRKLTEKVKESTYIRNFGPLVILLDKFVQVSMNLEVEGPVFTLLSITLC